ncbi:MAG: trimeric intracellular cation channel family protein [Peptoniphilaceae bacterium]
MLSYTQIDFILEIIGTLAFASSGALVGIREKMDLLGVIVLGATTAIGGGCIRDIILGINPPKMFVNSSFALMAVILSLILFIIFYLKTNIINSMVMKKYEQIMFFLDAIGLGAFTVTGINTAIEMGFYDMKFLLIFAGMVTGVGGGIIRDVFSNRIPFIFEEQIYAMASFLGACFYLIFRHSFEVDTLMILSALIVILTRIIAVKNNINLPRIKF